MWLDAHFHAPSADAAEPPWPHASPASGRIRRPRHKLRGTTRARLVHRQCREPPRSARMARNGSLRSDREHGGEDRRDRVGGPDPCIDLGRRPRSRAPPALGRMSTFSERARARRGLPSSGPGPELGHRSSVSDASHRRMRCGHRSPRWSSLAALLADVRTALRVGSIGLRPTRDRTTNGPTYSQRHPKKFCRIVDRGSSPGQRAASPVSPEGACAVHDDRELAPHPGMDWGALGTTMCRCDRCLSDPWFSSAGIHLTLETSSRPMRRGVGLGRVR